MGKFVYLLTLFLVLLGCVNETDNNNTDTGDIPSGLVSKSDLKYLGAFRLPDGTSETKTWEWGGTNMTYYSRGDSNGDPDGYPGSIFGAGHAWEHQISEITIPVPVISSGKNVTELNRAGTLQGFSDVLDVGDLEIPRTGLQYLPAQGAQSEGKLYFSVGQHNQEGEKRASHGMMNTTLSNPEKEGLWRVGDLLNYVTNDYMFEIPGSWADKYAGGKYLATGRFRDGGQGGMGPSLIAIDPWENGTIPGGSVIDAKTILLYENAYLNSPQIMKNYHHSDEWSGGIWVTTKDKAAVIFAGTKGIGECWYGFSNGVVWEEPYPLVPEYPHDDRGWWSTEFQAHFLFYDPADLSDVAEGTLSSYEPQPYESADMGEYLFNGNFKTYNTGGGSVQVQQKYRLGGCSYDRVNSIIYVIELFADRDKPVVHAWKVE